LTGALMPGVTSCRASRSDLRGSLRGSAVDKFGGTLCVGGGGEHCSVISSQHFQPGCDVGRMIFARFQSKLQIGAQESGAKLGNKFLATVTFVAIALAAQVAVKALRVLRPVRVMPTSA
jgi:hypothetical protein